MTRVLWVLLLFAGQAYSQQAGGQDAPAQEAVSRPVPVFRVDGLSAFAEGDLLHHSFSDGITSDTRMGLFTAGGAADASARLGRRTQLSVAYHGTYSYNHRYSSLNGANHVLVIGFQTDPARRTVFTLTATGESGIVASALFDLSYTLALARQAASINQLQAGLTGVDAGSVVNSPVELALAGGRRRSAAAFAGVTRSHSRRLSSFLQVGGLREIHSYSQEAAAASSPNVSVAMANAGVRYLLSPRTRIGGDASYSRSYSRDYRADWQSAGLGIDRQFGRRSFAALQGGYSRMTDHTTAGYGRSSYVINGALGTNMGFHTFAIRVYRSVADLHGLRADASMGVNGAWSWAPRASLWTLGGGVGFERLQGSGVGSIQALFCQANAIRRLSTQFNMEMTAMYVTNSVANVAGLRREGVRMALVWRPGPDRRQ